MGNVNLDCEACKGVGVLFDTQPPPHFVIERCDACKRFASDDEAGAHLQKVAEALPALLTALRNHAWRHVDLRNAMVEFQATTGVRLG